MTNRYQILTLCLATNASKIAFHAEAKSEEEAMELFLKGKEKLGEPISLLNFSTTLKARPNKKTWVLEGGKILAQAHEYSFGSIKSYYK